MNFAQTPDISSIWQAKLVELQKSQMHVVGSGPDVCVVDLSQIQELIGDTTVAHWVNFLLKDHAHIFNTRTLLLVESEVEAAKEWAGRNRTGKVIELDVKLFKEAFLINRDYNAFHLDVVEKFSASQLVDLLADHVDEILDVVVEQLRTVDTLPGRGVVDATRHLFDQFDFFANAKEPVLQMVQAPEAQAVYGDLLRTIVEATRELTFELRPHNASAADAIDTACTRSETRALGYVFDGTDDTALRRFLIASLEGSVESALGSRYWNHQTMRDITTRSMI